MKWIRVPIGVQHDHVCQLHGQVRECPDCGRREWWLFKIAGLEQQFVQCVQCNRVETNDSSESSTLELYALALKQSEDVVHPLTVPGKEVTS